MSVQTEMLVEILDLKVDESMTPYDLSQRIAKGLPVRSFNHLCDLVAPGNRWFRTALIPRSTLQRRQTEKILSPDESDRIQLIAQVWAMALNVYKDQEKARRFLHEPHPLLRGDKPIEVALQNAYGANLVEQILGRLQHGSAA